MSRIGGLPPPNNWYPKSSSKEVKKDKVTLIVIPRFVSLHKSQIKKSAPSLSRSRKVAPLLMPSKRIESSVPKKTEGRLIAPPAKEEEAKGGSGFKRKASLPGKGFTSKQLQQLIRIVKVASNTLEKNKKEKITPQTFVSRIKSLHKDVEELRNELKNNMTKGHRQLDQIIKKGTDLLNNFKALSPKEKRNMLMPSDKKASALNQFKMLEHSFKQVKDNSLAPIENKIRGSKKTKTKKREKQFQMVPIPKGPLIQDNKTIEVEEFAISVTPVTNDQFAFFLTEMIKKGSAKIAKNGDIINLKKELLCKTFPADRLSQLQIECKKDDLRIEALPGTELHPVVSVTYRGAMEFCLQYGYQLPSEAEWERAAAMDPKNRKKKYGFGCGTDAIDPSYANYSEALYQKKMGNLSKPVGFFNGKNSYAKEKRRYQTKNATSPFGCYDMCGNANCWTETWSNKDKDQKITKGGSYASSLNELTVSSRRSLKLDEADGFTSFRVIKRKEYV